ncbi:hypothetical protein BH23GEM9_BH23GEM9_32430 [soil metagenome]
MNRVIDALSEPCLLVTASGRVEAANGAAQRLFGAARVEPGATMNSLAVEHGSSVSRYLSMCARTSAPLPGALSLLLADGQSARYRCQGALVQPGPDPLLLVRLVPGKTASERFLALNDKIQLLNREIHERRRAQEQLQEQAAELEHLAAELEQSVEDLQQQKDDASAAQRRAEQAANRLLTLAEAGAVLTASLDYHGTLEDLARAAVRTLADYCLTYAVDEEGRLNRIGGAHADPSKQPAVDRLVREYPTEEPAARGLGAVLMHGEAVLASEVSDEMLVAAATDEGQLAILRELAPTSSIVTPLTARGRTVGMMAVARTGARQPFGADDLALVSDLAHRAALALDNARLYHEAQRSNRAKSAFLATMSHELRTPLNAIVGYADLLDAEVNGPLVDEQRSHLGRIRSAAGHLQSLIEEILAYARIEAGKERIRLEPVNLTSVVRDTVEMLRPALSERGLSVGLDSVEEVQINTDAGKLKQILLNLLGNAAKFTADGGVHVEIAPVPGGARIVVSDTGLGIAPGNLRRIFEPFWQEDHGPTRQAGGTGLGLTVSQRLAVLLGGDISVESQQGVGSTFILTLPGHSTLEVGSDPT